MCNVHSFQLSARRKKFKNQVTQLSVNHVLTGWPIRFFPIPWKNQNANHLLYSLRNFWREMTGTHVSSFLYVFRWNDLRFLSCFIDSPAVVSHSSLVASASGTPDLLVNSLELKRTLRKWSHDKEKVKEDGIIGDCFLCHVLIFGFLLPRSSQVNPNSTLSIAWVLEGFFTFACGGNLRPKPLFTIKTCLKLEIAREMSVSPMVPVRC